MLSEERKKEMRDYALLHMNDSIEYVLRTNKAFRAYPDKEKVYYDWFFRFDRKNYYEKFDPDKINKKGKDLTHNEKFLFWFSKGFGMHFYAYKAKYFREISNVPLLSEEEFNRGEIGLTHNVYLGDASHHHVLSFNTYAIVESDFREFVRLNDDEGLVYPLIDKLLVCIKEGMYKKNMKTFLGFKGKPNKVWNDFLIYLKMLVGEYTERFAFA